jgi:phytanoyl-CoA hydroxylase
VQTEVSAEPIEHYRQQGFVVLEGFLEADELQTWRAVTDEAVRQRLSRTFDLTNQANPDTFYAQVFTQALNLRNSHPGMAKLLYDERLGRVAGTLAGVDGVRVWHDQALIKPPYGNHTAFHFDDPYWSFYSHDAVNVWVALDEATLANGCLWYLPGTQHEAKFELVAIGENLGDLFKSYPSWRQIEAVPAPCPAGSVIFHNALVAHAAGVNLTPYPRRAMTVAYMPEGSRFNGQQSILPEAYFKSLTVGDVLDNDEVNRLVWRRAG